MTSSDHTRSNGAILVSADGRTLPLSATELHADACGGLARVELVQTFTNPYAEPLHVTYQVPLPADAAVSGYRFRVGEREIVGEVDRKDRARERFEQAIVEGHTAALLEQDRSSLFTQEIGNIPPGAALVVELRIDQKLAWVAERGGGWEWRFPTVVAPRYLGAAGRVGDAAKVTTHTTLDAVPVKMKLALTIRDGIEGRAPESPSHALSSSRALVGTAVALAEGGAALDRDVVVRWAVAQPAPDARLDRARPPVTHARTDQAFGLLTLVPPTSNVVTPVLPRDLVVLLDTSGSMHGEPIDQAKRLATALVDRLGDRDRIDLIEFSTAPRAWKNLPVAATAANRSEAKRWIASLRASGGTEMRSGILSALATLRPEAQRQVVLVTDGLIGFESEIVGEIARRLPKGCRVHTVGIGSSVNRSLTMPAARAGRGCEIVIGIGEDPERAIDRMLAHTSAPIVVDVELSGDALVEHAPHHLPDLMGGAPAIVALRLKPEGGHLVARGRTEVGSWEQRITVPPTEPGEGSAAITALFGRERVEDLELRIAAGEAQHALDHEIVAYGLAFQISTRLTSWVAIDREVTIDPNAPTRHETMPQSLPHGMSAIGLGLRPEAPSAAATGAYAMAMPMQGEAEAPKSDGVLRSVVRAIQRIASPAAPPPPAAARPSAPAPGRAAPPPAEGAGPKKRKEMADDERPVLIARARRRPQLEQRNAPEPSPADSDEQSFDLELGAAIVHAPRTIAGRMIKGTDDRLVFEIDVPADGLQWQLGDTIELVLQDGTRVAVPIDRDHCTRDGHYTGGVRLRVACTAPAQAQAIVAVHVLGEAPLVITL
ncbi:MAG TPA: VIT domain-containing protein [Nannocystaceae bacterium]|nr:VIT domain-containing protein [Nannocystaceae bacterium]